MKKSIFKVLISTAAALGLYFAGYTYADAATNVTVQSGDSVWGISQKYNVTMDALEQANNINANHLILVGQSLVIPDGTNTSSNTAAVATTQTAPATTTTQATTSPTYSAPKTNATTSTTTGSSSDSSAKAWIAQRESGGSYSATNGRYIGKYQLDSSYLHGDYSAANQERVANQYVSGRYGSWSKAQAFWQANGWY